MQTSLFIGITVSLFALYLFIGYIGSRRSVSSLDYLLAGKSLGIPTVTATLLAAQVGGGMFLGTAQNPFHGLFYIAGVALGLLILGLGIAEKMRMFNASTIGEILETTYQSTALRHLGVILSVISLLGILIGQILAVKSVLVTFANINDHLFFILFWLGIVTYTMIGGLHTIIITDFFRIIFIILIFSGICLYSLFSDTASFFSSVNLTRVYELFQESQVTWQEALRIILVPALFCLIEEDLAQKFFSARTKKIAGISALLASGLLLLFAFVPFYFGIKGKFLDLALGSDINPLLPVLTSLTSPFFFTIALCGILAAITSTSDSLLCALTSILTKPCSELFSIKPTVTLSRLIILVSGISTLAISYFFPEQIINVLVASYEVSISALFVPFLGSLFLKECRAQAAWMAAIVGISSFLMFKMPITYFPAPLDSFLALCAPYATFITLAGSLIAYLLAHMNSSSTIKD